MGSHFITITLMAQQVSDFVHQRQQKRIRIQIVVDRDLVILSGDGRQIIAEARNAAALDLELKIKMVDPFRDKHYRLLGNVLFKD